MMFKKLPIVVQIILVSNVFFLVHFVIATSFDYIDVSRFLISYAIELVMTLLIIIALIKINKQAKQQLGFAFLGISTLKVGISYFFVIEYLFQNKEMFQINKTNFFFIFLFFLSLDVYFTIRLLNKK